MHYVQSFLEEVAATLERLGLSSCDLCGSEQLGYSRYPVVMVHGALPGRGVGGPPEPGEGIDYFVKIECLMCGKATFVNAERHRSGDVAYLARGDVSGDDS